MCIVYSIHVLYSHIHILFYSCSVNVPTYIYPWKFRKETMRCDATTRQMQLLVEPDDRNNKTNHTWTHVCSLARIKHNNMMLEHCHFQSKIYNFKYVFIIITTSTFEFVLLKYIFKFCFNKWYRGCMCSVLYTMYWYAHHRLKISIKQCSFCSDFFKYYYKQNPVLCSNCMLINLCATLDVYLQKVNYSFFETFQC